MDPQPKKACVTGGNGFMATLLIKQLLAQGYAVNATVRDPENLAKVSFLKKLEGAPSKLEIFRADLTEEGSFDAAVSGCDYVFHVAAPVNCMSDDPENELIKPAIQGMLNVMRSCVKSKTLKRIVVTSSASTVTINSEDRTGVVLNEESWSDTDFLTSKKPLLWGYVLSKTLAEKEAWKFALENKIDLVTVVPTLMLGTALALDAPPSIRMALSLFSGEIEILKSMQEVSGSISLVHVEDACRAHIFVAESKSVSGRYICCASNTNLVELAQFLSQTYPQYKVPTDQFRDVPVKAKLSISSEKLIKAGFKFKHTKLEEVYDETIEYAKAVGLLSEQLN